LINRVVDQASGRVDYPPMLLKFAGATSGLVTVEAPETDYAEDVAYDMEASAFFITARRFVTMELIQVVKVVSDNPEYPVEAVTEQKIEAWITAQLQPLTGLVEQLGELAGEYQRLYGLPGEFLQLAGRVRLSASQRVQLESCYRRFYALGGSDLTGQLEPAAFRSARSLLQRIGSLLSAL
jgi:hypothetical protein